MCLGCGDWEHILLLLVSVPHSSVFPSQQLLLQATLTLKVTWLPGELAPPAEAG